jgi:MFS family permease
MTEAREPRFDLWALTGGKDLLQRQGFRRLLLSRLLAQLAQNSLLYGLFVLIAQKTDNSIFTGFLVLSFAVPSALLGPLSGVVIDRFSRGWLLVTMHSLRTLMCLGVLASDLSVWVLYLFAVGLAASMQFVGPAESAALPQVLQREELTRGNSLYNLSGFIGQAGGMAVLAPILLKLVGADPLYAVAGLLFALAAGVISTVSGLDAPQVSPGGVERGVRNEFAKAWYSLRSDMQSYMALVVAVVAAASIQIGVTVIPRYASEVLDISVENVIFVFAPGAIGVLFGLRIVGWLERHVGKGRILASGFILLVVSFLAFGFVGRLAGILEAQNPLGLFDPGPLDDQWARILMTMAIAAVLGLAYSLVGVVTRAVINERVPVEMQGRVFAAMAVLSSLASILPLLLVGGLVDLVGVRPILVAIALIMSLLVLWLWWRARFIPRRPMYG